MDGISWGIIIGGAVAFAVVGSLGWIVYRYTRPKGK